MAKPGVVLKRPVGTDRPSANMPSCPPILVVLGQRKPPASRKVLGRRAFVSPRRQGGGTKGRSRLRTRAEACRA
jgi:hypothetical protein